MPTSYSPSVIDEVINLLAGAPIVAKPGDMAAAVGDPALSEHHARGRVMRALEVTGTPAFRSMATRAISVGQLPTVIDEPVGRTQGTPALLGRRWIIVPVATPADPVRVGARWYAGAAAGVKGQPLPGHRVTIIIDPAAWERDDEDLAYRKAIAGLNAIRKEALEAAERLRQARNAGADTAEIDREIVALLVDRALRLDF